MQEHHVCEFNTTEPKQRTDGALWRIWSSRLEACVMRWQCLLRWASPLAGSRPFSSPNRTGSSLSTKLNVDSDTFSASNDSCVDRKTQQDKNVRVRLQVCLNDVRKYFKWDVRALRSPATQTKGHFILTDCFNSATVTLWWILAPNPVSVRFIYVH